MLDETRIPDRTVAELDEVLQRRQLQNSPAGVTKRNYPISSTCIMVLAVEMDREWTPQEYFAAISALKSASPADSVPTIEMVRIVAPSEVPDTDTCDVHLNVHPRFTAK